MQGSHVNAVAPEVVLRRRSRKGIAVGLFTSLVLAALALPSFAQAAAPTVTSAPPTDLSATGAQLNGTVNPNGLETTCEFEWGVLGQSRTAVSCDTDPGSGSSGVNVSAQVPENALNVFYVYDLKATNVDGTGAAGDLIYQTHFDPGPGDSESDPEPVLITDPISLIESGPVQDSSTPATAGTPASSAAGPAVAASKAKDSGAGKTRMCKKAKYRNHPSCRKAAKKGKSSARGVPPKCRNPKSKKHPSCRRAAKKKPSGMKPY